MTITYDEDLDLPLGPVEAELESWLDEEQEIVDSALKESKQLVDSVDFYTDSWDNYSLKLTGVKLA